MTADAFDAAEVAAAMFAMPETETDGDLDKIENILMERFGVDLDQFSRLLNLLIPLCGEGKSPMTGTIYRGFARPSGLTDGDRTLRTFIVKQKVKP